MNTVRNIRWADDGTIAEDTEVEVPAPEPTQEDRLAALTDAVEALAFDMLMQQMGGA